MGLTGEDTEQGGGAQTAMAPALPGEHGEGRGGGGTGTREATLRIPSELWVPSSAWPAPQLGLGTERKEEFSPSLGSRARSVRLAGSRPPFRIHTSGIALQGPERSGWCCCLAKGTGEGLAASGRGLCLRSPRPTNSGICALV